MVFRSHLKHRLFENGILFHGGFESDQTQFFTGFGFATPLASTAWHGRESPYGKLWQASGCKQNNVNPIDLPRNPNPVFHGVIKLGFLKTGVFTGVSPKPRKVQSLSESSSPTGAAGTVDVVPSN